MRRTFQIWALIVILGSAVFWVAKGANRGWTKTSVPVKTIDEVTGLEGIAYEKRFLPGLDFLAVAIIASGILGSVSLFISKASKPNNKQTN